jgi:hypothetical protein
MARTCIHPGEHLAEELAELTMGLGQGQDNSSPGVN